MKHMPARKFRARCLSVMDDVNATGEPIIITKRGTPIPRPSRIEQQMAYAIFNAGLKYGII
jgi:antitoxin (DNA-binding transcriptional repressor) of toxin-antitoxin stability system